MKGRPRDPTRARRATGHRPKPGEPPKLSIIRAPMTPTIAPPPCPDCEGAGQVGKKPCATCEGSGSSLSAEMLQTWRNVIDALGPTTPLREGDAMAVELLVRQYHRVKQAGALVDKYGIVTRSESGAVTVSPFVKAERDASAAFLRLAEQFGLTVASRMRLGLMQLVGKTLSQQLADDLREGK